MNNLHTVSLSIPAIRLSQKMEKLRMSYQISFEIVEAEGGRWVKKQEFGSQFVLRIICLLRSKLLFL